MVQYQDQELHTVYQPIVDLTDHEILGYEALTRVNGRAPLDLLRRSYQEGEVAEFDYFCLNTALKILPDLPSGRKLFLNLEPITLLKTFHPGGDGEEFLKTNKANLNSLVFEVTEGVRLRDFSLVEKSISFMKKKKVNFAMDDMMDIGAKTFKLMSLRPHYLKLDLSIIQGISENKLHREIVRELIKLGNIYNSHIIAEGLEHEDDIVAVRQLGIRYGQGFYFARPHQKLIKKIDKPVL